MQYYTSRPVMVTKRALRLLWAAAQFGSGLAVDYLQGDIYGNSAKRARQLRGHIERLGPAYVKVSSPCSQSQILGLSSMMTSQSRSKQIPEERSERPDYRKPKTESLSWDLLVRAWGVDYNLPLCELFLMFPSVAQVKRGALLPQEPSFPTLLNMLQPVVVEFSSLENSRSALVRTSSARRV